MSNQTPNPYTFTRSSTLSTRALLDASQDAESALAANTSSNTLSAGPSSSASFPSTGGQSEDPTTYTSSTSTGSGAGAGDGRPALLGRSSFNYAQAQAAAQQSAMGTRQDAQSSDYREEGEGLGNSSARADGQAGAGEGFRPSFGRQQSWSKQDMKRRFSERLMGTVEGDGGRASGYSEGAGGGA